MTNGVELMRTVTAAFAKGDLQPLMAALHPDINWQTASRRQGPFKFHGDYHGRAGATEVLATISKDYTFFRLEPKEIIASGDVVWGYFDAGLFYDAKGTGTARRSVEIEMAIRWHLKDGKVIEHKAFFDTAELLRQQGVNLPAA